MEGSSLAPLSAAATGFALGASLIIAIGAQNAFVLRQGLRREHVGAIVLFCAAADAVLMVLGVSGVGRALAAAPSLASAMTALGAAFLAVYGVRALWRATRPGRLDANTPLGGGSRRAVLAQAAAFTLLNPHVYLDTVLLVGAVGAQQAPAWRPHFLLGACSASALWFTALGYGARALAPWFARPAAWRVLDFAVGLTMLALAVGLTRRLPLPWT
ncbi:MAG: LysE/ArgO family amino acid transporter [Aquincola sp.]|nr:LysE/ArgO family amino acid transporter [Aquincola sp.]MDH4290368.1 LysE/ArgO family amino acid transporter [Aquincola sp.]MDH5331252.1 LysE/ArgO family amino acid transporter [Aquincola sp.]